jgi:hypothetical protein
MIISKYDKLMKIKKQAVLLVVLLAGYSYGLGIVNNDFFRQPRNIFARIIFHLELIAKIAINKRHD